MKEFLFALILGLFFISVYVFIKKNKNKAIMPSLIGWAIIALASILNLLTFFIYDGWTYANTLAGIMHIGNILGVFFIILFLIKQKTKNLSMNNKDKFMLGGCVFIVLFWLFSKNHYWANLFVQALMAAGYFFFINAMIKEKKKIDSFTFWLIAHIASWLALPLTIGDELAQINTWRSIISTALVLAVMAYYGFRSEKEKIVEYLNKEDF